MAISFITNGVRSSTAPIKWKFQGHPTIWFSLPGNFENNIVVKCHYLGLPQTTKVVILNGEVLNCSRVLTSKQIERLEAKEKAKAEKEEEKITKEDDSLTGITTTLAPELGSVASGSVADPQPSVSESFTTTVSDLPTKRKKDREAV